MEPVCVTFATSCEFIIIIKEKLKNSFIFSFPFESICHFAREIGNTEPYSFSLPLISAVSKSCPFLSCVASPPFHCPPYPLCLCSESVHLVGPFAISL
jgi:hypothetical protein